MKAWNIILATIVIFGAGVITGGLLVDHVKHPVYNRPPQPPRPPGPPSETGEMPGPLRAQILNKQFVGQLNDELELSKEQRDQIQRIISQGQQSTHDLWKLVSPQFALVWRNTRQQIREVLTPEQRKKFEILMKQQRRSSLSSTNTPPVQMPTNVPPAQPGMTTNGVGSI